MGFYTGIGMALVVTALLHRYEPIVRMQLAHPIPVSPFTP